MRDDKGVGIVKVPLQIAHLLPELDFGEQTLHHDMIAHTFKQVAKNVTPTITRRVDMNPGSDLNVQETACSKHLVCLSSDEQVDSYAPGVHLEHFHKPVPRRRRRMTE